MTRAGVARASWIDSRHLPQNVRPLIHEGFILERTSHVKGGTRRQKAYFLTDSGRKAAIRLRESIKEERVRVRDASGVRVLTISQTLREAKTSRSLLEIARQAVKLGTVDLSTVLRPAGTETETILPDASRIEEEYDWVGAAEVYGNALASAAKVDFAKLAPLHEHRGYALHRAALQAGEPGEFRERTRQALESFAKAKESFGESSDPKSRARVIRCTATAAYLRFWLASTFGERKRELEEAWELMKAALRAFEDAEDTWGYGTTQNRLSLVPLLRFYAEWDAESQEPVLREAIQYGEQSIRALTSLGDRRELAKSYVSTARLLDLLSYLLGSVGTEDISRPILDYREKVIEIYEEAAMTEPFCVRSLWGPGTDKAFATYEKGLEYARRTRDRLVIGWMLGQLAIHKLWKSYAIEDLEDWKNLLDAGLEDADNARKEFAAIAFGDIVGGSFSVDAAQAEYYVELSRREVDSRTRHRLLKKAAETAREGVKWAA